MPTTAHYQQTYATGASVGAAINRGVPGRSDAGELVPVQSGELMPASQYAPVPAPRYAPPVGGATYGGVPAGIARASQALGMAVVQAARSRAELRAADWDVQRSMPFTNQRRMAKEMQSMRYRDALVDHATARAFQTIRDDQMAAYAIFGECW